jgi:hypothetical protein
MAILSRQDCAKAQDTPYYKVQDNAYLLKVISHDL